MSYVKNALGDVQATIDQYGLRFVLESIEWHCLNAANEPDCEHTDTWNYVGALIRAAAVHAQQLEGARAWDDAIRELLGDCGVTGTDTATCGDCDTGWRGPCAHTSGESHEATTGHTVWYDRDGGATETKDSGPFRVVTD